jgi:hypothetical protein
VTDYVTDSARQRAPVQPALYPCIRASLDSGRFGWKRLLGIFGLLLTSVLVVPGLVLVGYLLRVTQAAAAGYEQPPSLSEWRALLKEGTVGTLVLGVFVPAVVLGVLYGVEMVAGKQLTLALLVASLLAYPGVVTVYAVERDVRRTLRPSVVASVVLSTQYLRALAGFAVVVAITGALVLVAATFIIPIPIVYPYAFVAWASYWGYVLPVG